MGDLVGRGPSLGKFNPMESNYHKKIWTGLKSQPLIHCLLIYQSLPFLSGVCGNQFIDKKACFIERENILFCFMMVLRMCARWMTSALK